MGRKTLCIGNVPCIESDKEFFFASEKATMRDMTTHLFDVTSQYRKMSE